MEQNKCDRCDEVLSIAAGAEMITLFYKGYKEACDMKCGHEVILNHVTEEYTPPVGQNIRLLRVASGMTQRQLAYKLRVSMQAVSKWECGQAYPDVSLLVPIARLFEVTLDELFGCT